MTFEIFAKIPRAQNFNFFVLEMNREYYTNAAIIIGQKRDLANGLDTFIKITRGEWKLFIVSLKFLKTLPFFSPTRHFWHFGNKKVGKKRFALELIKTTFLIQPLIFNRICIEYCKSRITELMSLCQPINKNFFSISTE